MSYFVTGATGFIGRFLIGNLLARKGTIHVLVRKGSQKKLDELIEEDGLGWKTDRAVPATWPTQPRGLHGAAKALVEARSSTSSTLLRSTTSMPTRPASSEHRWHPQRGADWRSDQGRLLPSRQFDCRRRACIRACSVKTCSTRPKGSTPRVFPHQARVRKDRAQGVRTRSLTASIAPALSWAFEDRRDRQDRRPVLLLHPAEAHARSAAAWMPTIGIEGGRINLVPVDYVVDAMDHIAHKPGSTAGCFHLTDPSRAHRRGAQHLRARRPCAEDDDAARCAHVRLRPRGFAWR
jgi:hypothetical protein